jgi:enediyne biosynthesis protein E4
MHSPTKRFSKQLIPVVLVLSLLWPSVGCDWGQPEKIEGATKDEERQKSVASAIQPRFVDVTKKVQLDSTYRNGEESQQFSIAESLGGGVATFDFDRDGRADLFFPAGGLIEPQQPLRGYPGRLYRQNGDGSFEDVAKPSETGNDSLYSHGATSADVDSDGFPDLLVSGYGAVQLFMNCGDGTYQRASEAAGLSPIIWATSTAWGDFDGDGHTDLYVAQYVNWSWENNPKCGGNGAAGRDVCTPQVFEGLDDQLFWNNGDGTFSRDVGAAGLVAGGKGLGVMAFDANQDSKTDIYVANDTTNNFLYLNQGGRKFKEIGVISGTAFDNMGVPNGSMGIAVFDQNDDMKPDLFVTNYERETFAVYQNDGAANFRHISDRTGITALGKLLVGFGTLCGDFTLSGREDVIVANGHVMQFPSNGNRKQEPLYIQNRADRRLSRIQFQPSDFFGSKYVSRGVIAEDLNGDGMLDLVFSNINEPAVVLKNESASQGAWVRLNLIGTVSNRNAIGTLVVLETDQGTMLRQVVGGGSYLSQGPYSLHWGIPANAKAKRFSITWPNGSKQQLEIENVNQTYTIVE